MWTRLAAAVSREDLLSGVRFLRDLPAYLHRPVSTEEAHAALRYRLERREDALLALLRRLLSARPPGLYRRLLDLAGCDEGDLTALVRREGVESTLRVLARHGVYLTADEFKGRTPLVRSGRVVALRPGDLRAVGPARHFTIQTSASRSVGTIVPVDLAYLRDCAVDLRLAMEARGGANWRKASWHVPGGVAIARLLEYAAFGHGPERWFTQVDMADGRLHPRYRWSARVLRAGGWPAAGCPPRSTCRSPTPRQSSAGCATSSQRAPPRTCSPSPAPPPLSAARPLPPVWTSAEPSSQ